MFSKFKNLQKLNLLNVFNLGAMQKRVLLISALGLLVFINALIAPFSLSLDLSKGKAYSLSSSTKKILREMSRETDITFFSSSDLPTRFIPLKRDVVDLLEEYKKEGGSKLKLKIVDPKKDPKALAQAREQDIPELQFSQVEQNKFVVTSSYFGILLSSGDRKEVVPQVAGTGNLEYNLTAAIYKITRKDSPKIGIVGQDENPQLDQATAIRKILSQQFTVDTFSFTSESKVGIDTNYKTLLVFGGNKQFSTQEIESLANYLEKGGRVLFFVEGVGVKDNLSTSEVKHNLLPLLKKWGITVEKNLVLSGSSELVNFGNEIVSYLVPYPFWLKSNNFNPKSSYFTNITQLTYPWASSIKLQNIKDVEVKELVKTTKQSWVQKDNFILNPQSVPRPKSSDLNEFVITAEARRKKGGQIVVIPSSRFILDRYLSRNSGNVEFVLNVVNDLASGGILSGIRQRAVEFYPLPDLAESQKDIFKYANILFLPVLFGMYGFWRLLNRRR